MAVVVLVVEINANTLFIYLTYRLYCRLSNQVIHTCPFHSATSSRPPAGAVEPATVEVAPIMQILGRGR